MPVLRDAAKFIAAEVRAAILGKLRRFSSLAVERRAHALANVAGALAEEPVPWPEVHLVQVDEREAGHGSRAPDSRGGLGDPFSEVPPSSTR